MDRLRVGVLASGRGTDFQSLVDARDRGDLAVEIVVLVCNVPGAPVIARAKKAEVPAVVIDHRPFGKDRAAFEREVVKVLKEKRTDLVVFAGSLPRVTQTLSLAVYAEFARSFDVALAIGGLLVAFSFALLLVVKWLSFGWTSPFRFAASSSA